MPVTFVNKGAIPIDAIRTFGVNAKESDDAIGYFGTGLKYALAVLLRCNCTVELFVGAKRYSFMVEKQTIRNKDFDVVYLAHHNAESPRVIEHKETLGFTTELGKGWEPWQAFRELYCNTLDESGQIDHVDEAPPDCFLVDGDVTLFVVSGRAIEDVWMERHNIFLSTEPVHEGPMAHAHIGPGNHIYYRGIRVMDLPLAKTMYDYNLTSRIELTEDRTIKYPFQARHAITSLVLASDDRDFIESVLKAPKHLYENDINFTEVSMNPGPTFLDVVQQCRENCERINHSAVELHRKKGGGHVLGHESIDLDQVQQKQLDRAIQVCRELGCDMDAYPVVVLETLGNHVWGRAEADTIYLSLAAFRLGTKVLAGTIFEEYAHLALNMSDESREFQNYLIDTIMSLHERVIGEPI